VTVFGPISRQDLIKYLGTYGFEGSFAGSKHQLLVNGTVTLLIPI
jgi:hypothetical protein